MIVGYPQEILPRKEFDSSLCVRGLLFVYPNLSVCRRIDGVMSNLVEEIGGDFILRDVVYKGVNVANFSVNLVGGLFNPESHISFRPIDQSLDAEWKGTEQELSFEGKYNQISPCFPVYYSIREFLRFPAKQEMTFNQENDYLVYVAKVPRTRRGNKYLKQFSKGKKIELKVGKKVFHAPTCCNYWHMTFDLFPYESPDKAIGTSGVPKSHERILKYLKSEYLTKHVSLHPSQYKICRCFYYKGFGNIVCRVLIAPLLTIINALKPFGGLFS